ncbi:MAG: DUF924 family protein [Pseudomonadota bacterium]
MQPSDILDFWTSVGSDGWWTRNDDLDREIIERFSELHSQAIDGKLDTWLKTGDGALAVIIVLDQFSRNMFRGSSRAFAQDAQALSIAKTAIASNLDEDARPDLKVFFYLPYEHSETIADQELSVKLQHSIGDEPEAMKAALQHREIIQRFGRFPHRNTVLGRHTTPAEQAYLDGGGFTG